MNLDHVLMTDGQQHNGLFDRLRAPPRPLLQVLLTLKQELEHALDKDQESLDEETIGAWLKDLLTQHFGLLPPIHVKPHDSGICLTIARPLSLSSAINMQLAEGSPSSLRVSIKTDADKFTKRYPPEFISTYFFGRHWQDANCQDVITDLQVVIAYLIARASGQDVPQPETTNGYLPGTNWYAALEEWHTSIAIVQQGGLGMSLPTARLLSLPAKAVNTNNMEDGFDFTQRDPKWTNEFQNRPKGGWKRIDKERLANIRWRFGSANTYALLDENGSSSDMGHVFFGLDSAIIETILVLHSQGTIVTERYAILNTGITNSQAEALIGTPVESAIPHPLLAGLGTTISHAAPLNQDDLQRLRHHGMLKRAMRELDLHAARNNKAPPQFVRNFENAHDPVLPPSHAAFLLFERRPLFNPCATRSDGRRHDVISLSPQDAFAMRLD